MILRSLRPERRHPDLILTPAGNMIPGEHFPLCRTLWVLIIQDQSDYSLRLFLISQ